MSNYSNLKEIVATKQWKNTNQQTPFPSLVENESYVPVAGCVFEHIITNCQLSSIEKLYYLLADSLALINHRSGKQRSVALSCDKWAEKLNCSRSRVFALQKSLSEKGYFCIIKDKNKVGQNKRNIIIPTLPEDIFDCLSKTATNRVGEHLPFDSFAESKRAYLDRTKLYIKLNYSSLKEIVANNLLNHFQKIVWLDFYAKCYVIKKSKAVSISDARDFSFVISYQELTTRYSCNKKHLSKSIKSLQNNGFLHSHQFFIKKETDPMDNERQDKSLWKIILSMPKEIPGFVPEESQIITNFSEETKENEAFQNHDKNPIQGNGTFLDPDVAKPEPLLIRNLKENIFKNRSTENENFSNSNHFPETNQSRSNFSKNDLDLKKDDNETKPSPSFGKAMELKDFYPLSSEDCFELQKSSKRQFDQNVMNEILRDMANRLKGKLFKSKKAFMSYMSKVFAFEMREEPRVNNINFKIIAKGSEEEKTREKEKFLTSIENSLEVSPEWHFRKRLAAVLKPDTAYELLKAYKGVRVEEGVFTLNLSKHLELSGVEREIIFAHAKSTHDGVVTDGGMQIFVERLAVTMPAKWGFSGNPAEYKPKLQPNLWGDIRRGLIGSLGKFVDLHWFSKLEAVIDDEAKNLTLKAPNNFVKDWINQNYIHHIEKLAARVGFAIGIGHGDEKP